MIGTTVDRDADTGVSNVKATDVSGTAVDAVIGKIE